jgi:hypothetical protein
MQNAILMEDLAALETFLPKFMAKSNELLPKHIGEEKEMLTSFFEKYHPFIERVETLKKETAPYFNIFKILRYGHYETRLHTPFLVTLLSIENTHEQGTLFLFPFLKKILGDRFNPETIKKVNIVEELSIGDLGRIDIYIEFSMNNERYYLAVENKINASDQPNQLSRYYEYLESKTLKSENRFLVYLTQFGSVPSIPHSITGDLYHKLLQKRQLCLMSYHLDIATLLEESLILIKTPVLKETLKQYLLTIKNF